MINWGELVERLGFPIALSLILLWMGWRAGRWIANQVIIPVRDAHINFLGTLQITQQQQAVSLNSLAILQEQHALETSYIRQLLESQLNTTRPS